MRGSEQVNVADAAFGWRLTREDGHVSG